MNIITSLPDTYDLERYGKLETLDIQSKKDDESSEYLATYQRNCTVFKDGRYSVQLPWETVPSSRSANTTQDQSSRCTRFQSNYCGTAYRKRRSNTSSEVIDEQWSHHIKAHREALAIRRSVDVYFMAGRMTDFRALPLFFNFSSSIILVMAPKYSDSDFLSLHVIKPRVVATIHAFINECVPKTEDILPEQWDLCIDTGHFDCNSIFQYTSSCQIAKQYPKCGTTTELPDPSRCDLGLMVDTTDGVLLLVGVLFLGILIGLATTIAICLIFPKLHSWLLSKGREKPDICNDRSCRQYYSDIDDVKIQPISAQTSNDVTLYSVTNLNSNYSGQPVSDYELGDTVQDSGEAEQYEQLRRGVGAQLSRKYDALSGESLQNSNKNSTSVTEYSLKMYEDNENNEGNYFVLEKT